MSNIDPAEFIANIADLPIQQQITLVKAHVQSSPTPQWLEFVEHPAVRAWISRNVTAINASVKLPKSHGYNSNPSKKDVLPNE